METVKTIIYSVVYISITAALAELLCPEKYRKYLKTLLALICCVVIVSPLPGLSVDDISFNFSTAEDNADYKKVYTDALEKQYEQDLGKIIQKYSENYELILNRDVEREDYLQIVEIKIYGESDFEYVQDNISAALGISKDKIVRGD